MGSSCTRDFVTIARSTDRGVPLLLLGVALSFIWGAFAGYVTSSGAFWVLIAVPSSIAIAFLDAVAKRRPLREFSIDVGNQKFCVTDYRSGEVVFSNEYDLSAVYGFALDPDQRRIPIIAVMATGERVHLQPHWLLLLPFFGMVRRMNLQLECARRK